MAAPALTLPEAREQAREVGVLYQEAARRMVRHPEFGSRTIEEESGELAARVIEIADSLLGGVASLIRSGPGDNQEELRTMQAQTQALRDAAFLLLQEASPDEAWFWTPEWQAGEREAEAQIAAGEGTVYGSGEEFLAALEAELG